MTHGAHFWIAGRTPVAYGSGPALRWAARVARVVRLVRLVRVALVTLLLAACAMPGAAPPGPVPPVAGTVARVDDLVKGMTVEQKVGQLMVVSFSGTTVTAEAERMVRDYHVGGVILFQQNMVDAAQIRSLTSRLQAAARVPLLMAADQEGGPVVRITSAATLFPSQMAVGATFSQGAAASVGAATAKELRALGLNVNFAPVADVNSNPRNPVIGTRSYGGEPAMVGKLAASAIEATQREGVLAVAKHFPGHGDADVDSHRALPLIEHPLSRLEAVELPPFRAAIGAGVDGVMTAHLLLPALEKDPKLSATLSPAVLGYLRETLGFKGLIITDDLEMGAIVNDYGTAEAAKLAFNAGADVLLFRRTVSEQQRAHTLLVQAVKAGEIAPQRLDASVRRVLEAKQRRGILTVDGGRTTDAASRAALPNASPPSTVVGPPSGHDVALDVARRSMTLVKNDGGALPLKLADGAPLCVVYPRLEDVRGVEVMAGSPSAAPGSNAGPEPQTLGDAVKAIYPSARLVPVRFRPTAEERDAAQACVRDSRAAVLGSYNLHEYPAQAAFLKSLLPADPRSKPVAVVALRLPYDLAELDSAPALLAAYSVRPASLQAAAETLLGRAPAAPAGHLPVPVGTRWPLGFGLLEWSRADTVTGVR
jgi:beta-N-acetylhexosaminidase